MAEGPIHIHITPSVFTPPEPNGCEHANTQAGYGFADGGLGVYTYCNDCGQVIAKVLDAEEDGELLPEHDVAKAED